ncbi:MAG: hypothetical protein V1688_02015 [bacterium]
MKYYINPVACSGGFECCGQPCLQAAGDGVIKRGVETCCFTQESPPIEAADRARMVCPTGAIMVKKGLPLYYSEGTKEWEYEEGGDR